jgi:cell fate regulator YaaT (PSP1 superfamily)
MSGCSGCQFRGMSTAVEDTYVGVRFGEETNVTLCATGGRLFARGDRVVVDLDGGPAFGHVEQSPMAVFKPCQKSSARTILRPATREDEQEFERQTQNQVLAKRFCQERARNLGLEMKISRVDMSLNGKRTTIYFTAQSRVDFRQLVRDVSQRFATRVKMIQVGARDEAKIIF